MDAGGGHGARPMHGLGLSIVSPCDQGVSLSAWRKRRAPYSDAEACGAHSYEEIWRMVAQDEDCEQQQDLEDEAVGGGMEAQA